jgi:hypothetical protein
MRTTVRQGGVVLVALALMGGAVLAQAATRPACDLQTIFVHGAEFFDPRLQPQVPGYRAKACDVVFSDGIPVVLPPLKGGVPVTITVRNVGRSVITVSAPAPDVINGIVARYSDASEPWWPPDTALLCCAGRTVEVGPHYALTLIAMPRELPNSWFTR